MRGTPAGHGTEAHANVNVLVSSVWGMLSLHYACIKSPPLISTRNVFEYPWCSHPSKFYAMAHTSSSILPPRSRERTSDSNCGEVAQLQEILPAKRA